MASARRAYEARSIPDELKAYDRWVRFDVRPNGDKLPFVAGTDTLAKSDDPSTWASFDVVDADARTRPGSFPAFVIGPDLPFVFVDLDDVRSPRTGAVKAWAQAIVDRLDSFTEISASETGVHVFCRGPLPDGFAVPAPPNGDTRPEVYPVNGPRFAVMTGWMAPGLGPMSTALEDRAEALAELFPPAPRRPRAERAYNAAADGLDAADADAIAALLSRHYVPNQRHHVGLHAAGWMAKQGVPEEQAVEIIGLLAAGDDDGGDKTIRGVRDTYDKISKGRAVAGYESLRDLVGIPVAELEPIATILDAFWRRHHVGVPPITPDRPASTNGPREEQGMAAPELEHVEILNARQNGHGHGRAAGPEREAGDDAEPDGAADDGAAAAAADADDDPDGIVLRLASDVGNSRRLAARVRNRARFCKRFGHWLVYHEGRWEADDAGRVVQEAKASAIDLYALVPRIRDDTQRAAFAKHVTHSQKGLAINAAIALARSEPGIPVRPSDLDTDPWLLNVRNGTIDLRTGELRPHDPTDLITRQSPVAYDPDATAPTWDAFLASITLGRADLAGYLQRIAGYAASGMATERQAFVLYGAGRNGKGAFCNVLEHVLGDYSVRTPTETLMARRHDSGISNDLARLRGARFVRASETEEGRRFNVARVKDLTGNETISARFLFGEFFDFRPEFTLVVTTNHKPIVPANDQALWDRLRLVPFDLRLWDDDDPAEERTDPGKRVDKRLEEKLRAEAPGILRWIVEGCLAWQREGLHAPECVLGATQEYRDESDRVGAFLEDRCVVQEASRVTAGEIFAAYVEWATANGERPMSNQAFGRALAEKGFHQDRLGRARTRYWLGLGLVSTTPEGGYAEF